MDANSSINTFSNKSNSEPIEKMVKKKSEYNNSNDTLLIDVTKLQVIISVKKRICLFIILIISSLSMNFDRGIFPSCTSKIINDLQLTKLKFSFFGALVYFGTAFGYIILSVILNFCNRKWILFFSSLLSCIGILTFSFSTNFVFLCINRFLTGVFQATTFIYIPIWIDQYSPRKYKILFMGIYQLSIPIGIIVGYIISQEMKLTPSLGVIF